MPRSQWNSGFSSFRCQHCRDAANQPSTIGPTGLGSSNSADKTIRIALVPAGLGRGRFEFFCLHCCYSLILLGQLWTADWPHRGSADNGTRKTPSSIATVAFRSQRGGKLVWCHACRPKPKVALRLSERAV